MDFLDPKLRRRHTIKLLIGYGLMATLITLITVILVFQAYGFDVNRKTGEVIQNGLVFVDSAPDKAKVILNGTAQDSVTNNRFSLPSGDYNLKLQKNGYRQWERNFNLVGGEVERFSYPLLVPATLQKTEIVKRNEAPKFSTQSPDRRWMVNSVAGSLTEFAEYDLNNLTNKKPITRTFTVPASVYTADEGEQSIEPVEWSNDNKHVLVKHNFAGKYEFILVSRDQPETSININLLLNANPTSISLQDKKFDKWYIYQAEGGVLQLANANAEVTPVLTGITSYKSHDTDMLIYTQPTNEGKLQRISIKLGNETYKLKDLPLGSVFLDLAKYDGSLYVAVGSDADQKTYIYRNPVKQIQRDVTKVVVPFSVLKATGPLTNVKFSENTRFISAQSAQHMEVFDAEENQIYRYNIARLLDTGSPVRWMDGYRMIGYSGGKAFIFDFDQSNIQELVTVTNGLPLFFDREYKNFYNFEKTVLNGTSLRIPADQ